MPELRYCWDEAASCWTAEAMEPIEVPIYAVNASGQDTPPLAFEVNAPTARDAGGLYALECRFAPGTDALTLAPGERARVATFVFTCEGGSTQTACEGQLSLDLSVQYAAPPEDAPPVQPDEPPVVAEPGTPNE